MLHISIQRTILTAMLLIGIVTSGGALGQDGLHQVLQARQNEWASAFNHEDTEALASFYDEDAVLVPPGGRPVEGRSRILDVLTSLYSQIDELKLHTENVVTLGDAHAVEVGYNTYDAIGEDGSVARRSDNYVVVWRKDASGTWQYLREVLNQRSTASEKRAQ